MGLQGWMAKESMKRWSQTVLPPEPLEMGARIRVQSRKFTHNTRENSRSVGVGVRVEAELADERGVHIVEHVGPDLTDV